MPALIAVNPGLQIERRGHVADLLEGMAHRYSDIRPLALQVADLLRESFARNVYEGGRPAWQPLSPNTLASKALKGYPSKPLVATGLLARAAGERGAPGNVSEIGTDSLRVGVSLLYAKWVAGGTRPYVIVPKKKGALVFQTAGGKVIAKRVHHPGLPPRPFIVVQPEDWREIRALIKRWAAGELPAGG